MASKQVRAALIMHIIFMLLTANSWGSSSRYVTELILERRLVDSRNAVGWRSHRRA